jgi:alpha-ketoglutarate-dependent taurine dioxygenase
MQQLGRYERLIVKPIAGALGAEVEGVDLARLDEPAFAEIGRAFNEHLVLFFRNQKLTEQQFEAFGARFGKLSITYYVDPIPGSKYVHRIERSAEAKWGERNFGDNWHIDQSIRERPNAIFALYSVDCPPYGGDTMFTNLYLAYEALSPGMRALCDTLTVMHSSRGLYGADGRGGLGVKKPMPVGKFNITPEQVRTQLAAETEHPLVIRHPVTRRKVLYVTGPYCVRFKDMTEEESLPLITFLHQHAVRPEFTCRFRWSQGAVALMDNRCAQHFAVQDYSGFRREMLRLEVEGERPIGPANEHLLAGAATSSSAATS